MSTKSLLPIGVILARNYREIPHTIDTLASQLLSPGKLESQVVDYQNNLERIVKDRTRELTDALSEIKTLRGIIPICSNCKQIRDDEGLWSQIETYISDHSEAEFTHGYCPECVKELYPDMHGRIMKKIEDKKKKAT